MRPTSTFPLFEVSYSAPLSCCFPVVSAASLIVVTSFASFASFAPRLDSGPRKGNTPMTRMIRSAVVVILALTLVGCGGGEDETDPPYIPSSGGSGVPVPASIIGYKLVQYVERNDGKSLTIKPGDTITYSFIDAHTILGEGLNTLPTTSWSYTRTGENSATVELNYTQGFSTDELTFTSETEGTYESNAQAISGVTAWHAGTFEITGLDTRSGNGNDGGNGRADEACRTNNTGEITVYTTASSPGAITVYIDGNNVGSLSSYYTGDGPACGTSSDGAITETVRAGMHTVEASSSSGTWGPRSLEIDACGCSRWILQ